MAKVVVSTGQVSCPHQGVATLTPLPAKSTLVVDDSPVLTTSSTGAIAFPQCTNKLPNGTPDPCTQIASWTGASTFLEVGGEPVILHNSIPMTNKLPFKGSVQSAGQEKLEVSG